MAFVRRYKAEGIGQMQASMPAAFKFLILALLSKKPPLYGFLVLKPGSCDNLMGNFSRSGDRMLVSVPIYLPHIL
jgi:hypothetical protein